jgi:hypothetical protein
MTIIPLGAALLPCSCDLPGGPNAPSRCVSAEADSLPIWSCSVWGLPCPDHCCPGGALLPHLFTLIRLRRTVYFLWHWPSSSLDAGIPDVIRHTALWSSDFPPRQSQGDRPVHLPLTHYSCWQCPTSARIRNICVTFWIGFRSLEPASSETNPVYFPYT